jgi:hypothetical protein
LDSTSSLVVSLSVSLSSDDARAGAGDRCRLMLVAAEPAAIGGAAFRLVPPPAALHT